MFLDKKFYLINLDDENHTMMIIVDLGYFEAKRIFYC